MSKQLTKEERKNLREEWLNVSRAQNNEAMAIAGDNLITAYESRIKVLESQVLSLGGQP